MSKWKFREGFQVAELVRTQAQTKDPVVCGKCGAGRILETRGGFGLLRERLTQQSPDLAMR